MSRLGSAGGLAVFLAVAFIPAYTLDRIAAPMLWRPEKYPLLLPLLTARMWLPALGVMAALAVEGRLGEWRRVVALRWPGLQWALLAALLVVAGYSASLPLVAIMGASLGGCEGLSETLGGLGVPCLALIILTLLAALAAGPTVNAIVALGEEVGWRGYMLDTLRRRYSLGVSGTLVGVTWGLWHAPLVLAGYDYRLPLPGSRPSQQPGGPEALLTFTLLTTALGILLAVLREASGSVYTPAAAHGTVNAVAGLYAVLTGGSRLIAPPAGLSVALSFAFLAIALTPVARGRGVGGWRRETPEGSQDGSRGIGGP